MQKTRAKISVILMIITVIAACVLHFFQLYYPIDTAISSPEKIIFSPYSVYLLMLLGFTFSAAYSFSEELDAVTFDFSQHKSSIYLSSIALAFAFFYDFIHQAYNCYSYASKVAFIEYAYIIPLGASSAFALLSSFYYFAFATTAKNVNYDFRNFTLLHFAPVVWAFSKLCTIMSRIVDVKLNVEICCEFVLLCVILAFIFSMISAVDRENQPVTRLFVFSSASLGFLSCVVGIPRLILNIIQFGDGSAQSDFSPITYIIMGAFSVTLLADIKKRSKIQQRDI